MNALLFLTLSLVAAASPLESVQENFKKHSEFKVSFSQEVEQDLFPDERQIASGVLKFKRPHFMHWTYLEPKDEKKEIIFDGHQLTIRREGEAETQAPHSGLSLEDSFSFLWGQSNSSQFDVKTISAKEFLLEPKNRDQAQFKSIRVRVEQGVVQEALITDLLDGKSRLTFKDWRFESSSKN